MNNKRAVSRRRERSVLKPLKKFMHWLLWHSGLLHSVGAPQLTGSIHPWRSRKMASGLNEMPLATQQISFYGVVSDQKSAEEILKRTSMAQAESGFQRTLKMAD